jgi:hypothetical protein
MVNAGERSSNETREESEGALMAKRKRERVEEILQSSSEVEFKVSEFVASNEKRAFLELRSLLEDLKRPQTALKDRTIQRTLRKLVRTIRKTDSVLRAYKRSSLFSSADLLADIIKIRRLNKTGFTPNDLVHIQRAFCELGDDFPEFLRMVAGLLDRKSVRRFDNKIEAAYDEAFKRCNAWFFEADQADKLAPSEYLNNVQKLLDVEGVIPSVNETYAIFREKNPALFEPRKKKPDGIAPSLRSFRRSLELLGCAVRGDKRGRPRKK